MSKRALLIGIDNYRDDQLTLLAPRNDVGALAKALGTIGYASDSVDQAIGSRGASLSSSSLRNCIRVFFRSAQPGEDLLLFVSGHGIEQGEHRLIVPYDYYLEDPQTPSSLVGDQFLYGEAVKSQARSILIVVDACRDSVRFRLIEDKSVPLPPPVPTTRGDVPTVAILYSCGRNQQSRADSTGDCLSFFTAAWCAMLEADDEVATLAEAIEVTGARLSALLHAQGLPPQAVTLCERSITGRGGVPERLLVKENRAARIRQRVRDSVWCSELQGSPLWPSLAQTWPALAAQIHWITLCAEDLFKQATLRLPGQRWRDSRAPGRIVQRLGILLGDDMTTLSVAEAAVATVVPYVYEGVLAAGELLLAAQGNPLEPRERTNAGRIWLAWLSALDAEEAFGRRVELLREQGLGETAEDLVAWQLVRFLHTSGELWEYASQEAKNSVGWTNTLLHPWFDPAPVVDRESSVHVTKVLQGRRLVRLARLAFGTMEDIEVERSDAKEDRLETDLLVGPAQARHRLNELAVAHVLNLAFSLATDVRRMSPLFAEHLGRPEIITAKFLQQGLSDLEWSMRGEALDACLLDCPHEVIDLALEDAVAGINRHRLGMNQTPDLPPQLLAAIPRFFSTAQVRARRDADGKPSYRLPHLRLTLDHSRIREILMEEALYGRAEIALRELYQNALDACRYRRARAQYLKSLGKGLDEYVPRIEFRSAVEDGRAYIECRDNGIGMSERHLRTLFARAGSRFTDSHEFHLEKARWAERGIKFWPNSRFGIGVFSYFMMADEIQVITKRLKEDGVENEPGLRLSVVGSGSLFRLQRAEGVPLGTTVRLYVNKPEQTKQLRQSICEWLWLPEIETLLFERDGTSTSLEAGKPAPGLMEKIGTVVPVPESAGANGQPRLFWALGYESEYEQHARDCCVLVDGIKTSASHGDLPTHGIVLNLTEDLRVDLSVDRSSVKDLRGAGDWLAQQIRDGAYRYILSGEPLSLLDIDLAFVRRPLALYYLDRALRAGECSTAHAVIDASTGGTVPLAGLGLTPVLDHLAFECLGIKSPERHERFTKSIREWLNVAKLRNSMARLVAARIRAIAEVAPAVVPPVWTQLAAFARHNEWLDQPSVGWLVAMDEYGRLTEVNAERLRSVAREWTMHTEELTALLDPLRPYVPEILKLGDEVVAGRVERPPVAEPLIDFLSKVARISLAHVAIAAIQFRRPLREVIEQAEHIHGRNFDLSDLEARQRDMPTSLRPFAVLSPKYLRIAQWFEKTLGKQGNSELLFLMADLHEDLPERLSLDYLLFVATQIDMTLGEVIDLTRPLANWGVALPDLRGLPERILKIEGLPHLFRIEFRDHLDAHATLSMLDLGALAKLWEVAVDAVLEFLRPFASCGIRIPDSSQFPAQGLGDLSWRLASASSGRHVTEINGAHLAIASLLWGLPLDDVIAAARPLRDWEVALPDLDAFPKGLMPKKALRDLLLTKENDGWAPRPYSAATLIDAADVWAHSIDDTLNQLRPWVSLLFGKQLPATPFNMDERLEALLKAQEQQQWGDAMSAWDLAVTAHRNGDDPSQYVRALDQLAQFDVNVDEAKAFAQFCQNQS